MTRVARLVVTTLVLGCAPTASSELCNGLDDDLDGVVDESAAPAIVRVVIDSTLGVPMPLARLELTVTVGGLSSTREVALRAPGSGSSGEALPVTFDVPVATGGGLAVTVEGFEGGGARPIVATTAEVSSLAPGTRVLDLALDTACLDVACSDGLVCDAGSCVGLEPISGAALEAADPEAERRAARLDCGETATCTDGECLVAARLGGSGLSGVDLLLMIDDSNSMAGEQALLAAEIPRFVAGLATGDVDADGTGDFPPVTSLHVGIVTSDMGAGMLGETIPTCRPGFGDDGILRTAGGTGADCAVAYPPVFEFAPGDDTTRFSADVACVASMGTGGCGFEQQLEAVLKAISPSAPSSSTAPGYVPPVFVGGEMGHGDGMNAGFLRPDSVLAVAILSDEEDCSVPDYALFSRSDPRFTDVGLNMRCFRFADGFVHPIDRYVEGLIGLRTRPELLVFAPIVGIPPELATSSRAGYDAILADPRMIETPDPSTFPPARLLSACNTADGGEAFPGRRYVALAAALADRGALTTVGSICAETFTTALDSLAFRIGSVFGGSCLQTAPPIDGSGRSACRLIEILPPGLGCAEGRRAIGTVQSGDLVVHRCEIEQTAPGASAGWYLDTSSDVCLGAELVVLGEIADATLVCPE